MASWSPQRSKCGGRKAREECLAIVQVRVHGGMGRRVSRETFQMVRFGVCVTEFLVNLMYGVR